MADHTHLRLFRPVVAVQRQPARHAGAVRTVAGNALVDVNDLAAWHDRTVGDGEVLVDALDGDPQSPGAAGILPGRVAFHRHLAGSGRGSWNGEDRKST